MQQPSPRTPTPLPSTHPHRSKHPRPRTIKSNPTSNPQLPSNSLTTSTTNSTLLFLLRQRKTEEAYSLYTTLSPHLPDSTCLSRLVAQLSYHNTPASLSKAQSIILRLRSQNQLHRLDANSLGLLAVSASKSPNNLNFALSIIRSMLRSHYLPHVKAWSAVVSRLSNSQDDDGPREAVRLYDAVLRHVRRAGVETEARPDTGAFNAVLNACANLGDVERCAKVFDEMAEFETEPDVLSYNVVIKMCARAERKDLLGFVLERIIQKGILPCTTTLHSLVAAYVGFGDLVMAEKIVQVMREERLDLCAVIRSSNEGVVSDNGLLEKLVNPNLIDPPPLLPKKYTPDTRIYTILMKGYMKEGRVDDVVRMIGAMKNEPDPKSHPDHVTYTTVISALANVGAMDRARNVLAEMICSGVAPNQITYNVLLKGYCQQLQLDKAKEIIQEMAKKAGIEPNEVSYNIMIDGCILMDDSTGALKYFNEMRERGIAPSKVSYTTLMKAFALSGQPKLANKVFDEMTKDPRVKVDRVAWNMLVEGYCRLGLIEEAKKIVERMKESGFQPDIATYGSLANGIAVARRPGEALLLWNEVKERCEGSPPFKPDEGLLDALADVCVRAAFFKKALEIVACMEDNGISPNKTKYKRIYVEMHSRMFTSKHASRARQERRRERKNAAEAFKFWLGLPNSYYGSEWRIEPIYGDDDGGI